MNRIIIALVGVAGLLLTSCLKEEALQLPFRTIKPIESGDGLQISTPENEGFDTLMLKEVYMTLSDEDQYPNIRSLLVMRNNKLVSEAYFKDPVDKDRLHAVMSVTKSFTSLAAGLAFEKGYLGSLDDKAYDYIPEYFDDDSVKRSITLRHILTMETGIDYDDEVHTAEMIYCDGSSLSYVLSRPQVFLPGEDWYYGDGNPQLLSGIIRAASGKNLEDLIMTYLFEPMGISNYFWEQHSDGLNLGGMGLWFRPRDMLKIGQLMINDGKWKGEQLISADWLNASTVQQAINRDYGFYWLTSDSTIYWASGRGGQLICIYPAEQLVVVVTSDSYAQSWALSKGSYDYIFQAVYDAIIHE
jgi:CubicO group peptidase (beta-lactamase class C family)